MLVNAESLASFAGYIGSLFVFGFTIVRVLDKKAGDRQNRMERRHQEEMNAIRQDIVDKHYHSNSEMKIFTLALTMSKRSTSGKRFMTGTLH